MLAWMLRLKRCPDGSVRQGEQDRPEEEYDCQRSKRGYRDVLGDLYDGLAGGSWTTGHWAGERVT